MMPNGPPEIPMMQACMPKDAPMAGSFCLNSGGPIGPPPSTNHTNFNGTSGYNDTYGWNGTNGTDYGGRKEGIRITLGPIEVEEI